MMVPFCEAPGASLVSGWERRLGAFFQNREGLEVAVEIDGGGGLVFVGFAVGGGELGIQRVNPERAVGGIVQR